MVDRRENECGSQALLTQSLQSVKKGAKLGPESLDDAVVPIVQALRDQPPGVDGEEAVIVAEIKPLRVPLGMVGRQPSGDVPLRLFAWPVFWTRLRQPAHTSFLTPVALPGARNSSPWLRWSHKSQCGITPK